MPGASLEALTSAAVGNEPVDVRAQKLVQHFQALAGAARQAGLTLLTETLNAGDPGGLVVRALATSPQVAGRQLALEVAARLPGPLDRAWVPVLRPLLLDRRLPAGVQLAAVLVLLATTGKSGAAAVDLLAAFVTGLDKTQVQQRLEALRQRVGAIPALAEMDERLAARLSQLCPRCQARVPRADLAAHLWRQHGLVLDGQLAREPWAVVEDWLADAAARHDPDRLGRCFELAQHADPEYGLARLESLLRAYGLETAAAPQLPTAVQVSRGRLAADGYRVEVTERGWRNWLRIETPEGRIFDGSEPGQRWTRQAVLLALVGPPVLAAASVAWWAPEQRALTAVLLTTGLGLAGSLHLHWLQQPAALDRAVDHAWELLVPRLHAQGFSPTDALFLGGLADASSGRGRPQRRDRALERLLDRTEQALPGRPERTGCLARLWRLAVEDSTRLGRDPVMLLARVLTRCLERGLPLALAEQLLDGWAGTWRTPGNVARLRAQVGERACESGFTVADLRQLGERAPALGAVLGTDQPDQLAHLVLLWSLRTARPWEPCGEAFTVFELASPGRPGAAALERCADLLLYQFLPGQGTGGPTAILVCSRGVIFGDALLAQPQSAAALLDHTGGREGLARRLERWLQFHFQRFLPQTGAMLAQPPTKGVESWPDH